MVDSSSSTRMDGIKSVLEGQGVRRFSFSIGTTTMSAWRNQKLGEWSSASFCTISTSIEFAVATRQLTSGCSPSGQFDLWS